MSSSEHKIHKISQEVRENTTPSEHSTGADYDAVRAKHDNSKQRDYVRKASCDSGPSEVASSSQTRLRDNIRKASLDNRIQMWQRGGFRWLDSKLNRLQLEEVDSPTRDGAKEFFPRSPLSPTSRIREWREEVPLDAELEAMQSPISEVAPSGRQWFGNDARRSSLDTPVSPTYSHGLDRYGFDKIKEAKSKTQSEIGEELAEFDQLVDNAALESGGKRDSASRKTGESDSQSEEW